MKKGDKSGQHIMGLPFSIIFSIFLIVIFIVIAFIAIRSFLDFGKCGSVNKFYDNFQEKIDEAWKSDSSEFDFKISLPSGIDMVCFADLESSSRGGEKEKEIYDEIELYREANTFLMPPGDSCNHEYENIKHINISEITKTKNPYCVYTSEKLRIKRDFYDPLVIVS